MSKPNILLITLKDLDGPGYVGRYHHLAEQMSKDANIYLFCAKQPWKSRDKQTTDWDIDKYVEELFYGYPISVKNPYINEGVNIFFNIVEVRKIISEHDIDLVLNGGNLLLGYTTPLWKVGIPAVLDFGDYYPELARSRNNASLPKALEMIAEKGIKHVQDTTFDRSDLVTANTSMLANYARGQSETDCKLISNGVNTSLFKPVESKIREEYDIGDDYLFGFGGTIHEHFLLEEVVSGFSEIKENSEKPVSLMIIGDGPNTEAVHEEIKYQGVDDSVIMPGSIEYTKLPKYYSAFDVGLNPMTTNTFVTEATRPLKVFEYLASGTPVITTPITELTEHVFPEQDQSVVSYVDFPRGFATEGLDFARNSRNEMVQKSARNMVVGRFDWDSVGNDLWTKVLRRII